MVFVAGNCNVFIYNILTSKNTTGEAIQMIFTTLRGKRKHTSEKQHRFMHAKELPHTHQYNKKGGKKYVRHYGGKK